MKSHYLSILFILALVSSATPLAYASEICWLGGSGGWRVIDQADFDRTWTHSKTYCPNFFHRTEAFEETSRQKSGARSARTFSSA